jgi:hypothetical protein
MMHCTLDMSTNIRMCFRDPPCVDTRLSIHEEGLHIVLAYLESMCVYHTYTSGVWTLAAAAKAAVASGSVGLNSSSSDASGQAAYSEEVQTTYCSSYTSSHTSSYTCIKVS